MSNTGIPKGGDYVKDLERKKELSKILYEADSLYDGIMHEVDRDILEIEDTDEKLKAVRENLVILARGFLNYEERLAYIQAGTVSAQAITAVYNR